MEGNKVNHDRTTPKKKGKVCVCVGEGGDTNWVELPLNPKSSVVQLLGYDPMDRKENVVSTLCFEVASLRAHCFNAPQVLQQHNSLNCPASFGTG